MPKASEAAQFSGKNKKRLQQTPEQLLACLLVLKIH